MSSTQIQVVRSCLQRRLNLWLKDDLLALFNGGVHAIQKHLSTSSCHRPWDDQPHSSRFAHLMTQGHVNAALVIVAVLTWIMQCVLV